ncbi:leucyl aminopeptidase [Thalassoroseus pseudoceratinae]|uniref:leucyl aminopeptidase n=1 Tax=Thalassoroseus pseudoceratinae TaxID=2713176 RepID=UPI00141D7A6D|nr:leucyl aminopeptidase [Thalassoroseus pseudoceratinae]
MELQLEERSWNEVAADWLIVLVSKDVSWSFPLSDLDSHLDGVLSQLRERDEFPSDVGETCKLPVAKGIAADRLLLVGLGSTEALTPAKFERAARIAFRQITKKKDQTVAVAWPGTPNIDSATAIQTAVMSAVIAGVGPGVYQSEPNRHPLKTLTLLQEASDENRKSGEAGHILGETINQTRDLVNRCADEIYPESVAQKAKEMSDEVGLRCRILDQEQLEAERMGSLLAVARASTRPPRVVVLEYLGASSEAPTLALCGKGVCFDSGGLSIKSSEGMNTMKADMAGAATVFGALAAIARLKLPVNVVGYLGLVENMISGSAYKLGDVLTARNGVTIEVLNTDAEGRLVLADVLAYAVDQGADKIVDLATLTGACVVALGEEVNGLFTNNSEWGDEVKAAAKSCEERVWELPMDNDFNDLLKSDVADCKNIGGRWGGAITAAKFLEKFVSEKPWVHLDIAGPSFATSSKSHQDSGATGVMVRTLVELARNFK